MPCFHGSNSSGSLETQIYRLPHFHFLFILPGYLLHCLLRLQLKLERSFSNVFFTLSENEDDIAALSVTPDIMVLSVGKPAAAGFSVEMSDSSDISSHSRVLVEVAKSWPCSTRQPSLTICFCSTSCPILIPCWV